jgi:hypothetical protein
MAFDGNGNFVRLHNWQQDAANGIDISAPEMDGEDNGFAAGLSLCVTRDGQGKMAADLVASAANTYNLGTGAVPWNQINGASLNVAGAPVYPGCPINLQAGTAYTLVIGDANTGIRFTNAAAKALAIPANGSVPFPVGTMISGVNDSFTGNLSISITTDTLRLAGTTSTGTRTVAPFGTFTLWKTSVGGWFITGVGIT